MQEFWTILFYCSNQESVFSLRKIKIILLIFLSSPPFFFNDLDDLVASSALHWELFKGCISSFSDNFHLSMLLFTEQFKYPVFNLTMCDAHSSREQLITWYEMTFSQVKIFELRARSLGRLISLNNNPSKPYHIWGGGGWRLFKLEGDCNRKEEKFISSYHEPISQCLSSNKHDHALPHAFPESWHWL